ncbi:gamma subclass chorismate mutase AroQ [Nocardia sp. NPDC056100]|uniref:gamma subclass chorismate mutase AroQ n=1 Tax=Nocardia sp. NPDC056100 TaxID=3345712 RepID=UPI0035E26587
MTVLFLGIPVILAPVSVAAPPEPGSLDALVTAIADRIELADAVAAAKWETARATRQEPVIDDPDREAVVYSGMAALGAKSGLSERWVDQVFAGQIDASKIVQRGLILRWNLDQGSAPTVAVDLTAVRPEIDRTNVEIIDQMADRRPALTGPGCGALVIRSVMATLAVRPMDPLHQAALFRATLPLCPVG